MKCNRKTVDERNGGDKTTMLRVVARVCDETGTLTMGEEYCPVRDVADKSIWFIIFFAPRRWTRVRFIRGAVSVSTQRLNNNNNNNNNNKPRKINHVTTRSQRRTAGFVRAYGLGTRSLNGKNRKRLGRRGLRVERRRQNDDGRARTSRVYGSFYQFRSVHKYSLVCTISNRSRRSQRTR